MEFHAYQWKDAYVLELYRKWNLISLPLVPFETDIATMVLAGNVSALIDSVWNYDRCSDSWATYPGAGLTDMVDGKAYWVKVDYSLSDPTQAPGTFAGIFWVWGVDVPMPPDAPSAYEVCEGWNMVGFRSRTADWDDGYLWNLVGDYGPIYKWQPVAQAWDSDTPTNMWMVPGRGFWVPFSVNGYIYP